MSPIPHNKLPQEDHPHTTQLLWTLDRLNDLSATTLVLMIDELKLDIPDNRYAAMAKDVLRRARTGATLSARQRRVLVNIICQPR